MATVAAAALVLTGCAGSSGSGGAAAQNESAPDGATVSIKATDKGDVLTNADGRTLYVSDQESSGQVLCTSSSCTAIWSPLVVAAGQAPSGPTQLSGMLTTVQRPDGKAQVALDGKPLYTFAFDHAAGQVNGDAADDNFDGKAFSWHVATAAGTNGASSSSSGSSSSSSNHGYGY